MSLQLCASDTSRLLRLFVNSIKWRPERGRDGLCRDKSGAKKGNKFSMTYQTSFKRAMEVGQCEGENRIIMHRGDVKWHKNVVLLSLRRLFERKRKKMRSRRRHKNGSSWGEGGKSIDECFPFHSLTRLLLHSSRSPWIDTEWRQSQTWRGVVECRGRDFDSATWFRNPTRVYLITNPSFFSPCVFL